MLAHLKPKSSISSCVTYLASSEFGSILVSGVTVKLEETDFDFEPTSNLTARIKKPRKTAI